MKKLITFLVLFTLVTCTDAPPVNVKLAGPIFGTGYNIQYHDKSNTNYLEAIEGLFNEVNTSLSTYMEDSDISKLNRNEITTIDHHFKRVFEASKGIYRATEGAFDPTIGNVVNAWNFGAEQNKFLTDSTTIDSLMRYVGFNRLGLKDFTIIKPKTSYLEFNAIAKGYGIDVIAEFLESKGIENYLVDIGGDLRVSGINVESGKGWTVGIDDPNYDGSQSYSKVVVLVDEAMATSGTYRKYKTDENGNKYAHIINTKTGYPTKTNILSVSIIAPDCMTADGYATAFQAMGIEKATAFLERQTNLKAYFIYEDATKELKTLIVNDFPE